MFKRMSMRLKEGRHEGRDQSDPVGIERNGVSRHGDELITRSIDIQRDALSVQPPNQHHELEQNRHVELPQRTVSPEISPPNSPISANAAMTSNAHHRDVSPIDPEQIEFPSSQRTGSAAIGRQTSLRNKLFPSLRSAHGTGPTKWDKYTGERTNKQTGKAGTSHNSDLPVHKILAQMHQSRVARNESKRTASNPSVTSTPRPAWRGASGRQAHVPPILTSPASKHTPLPEEIRPSFDKQRYSPVVSTTELHPTERSIDEIVDDRAQNPVISQIAHDTVVAEEVRASTPVLSTPVLPTPDRAGTSAKLTEETPSARDLPSSPRGSIISIVSRKALPATSSIIRIRQAEAMQNPSSRFSWTTVDSGTTNYTQGEFPPRRDSILPPPSVVGIDSPERINKTTHFQPNGRSPSPSAYSDRSASSWEYEPAPLANHKLRASTDPTTQARDTTMRAATTNNNATEWQYSTTPTPSIHRGQEISPYAHSIAPSAFSTQTFQTTNKALPLPPPALEATDLISQLEARLTDLSTQKRNLRRIQADYQKSSAAALRAGTNPATKREDDLKLAGWKEEMEEVEKCEHEVGVRLHRAWRRREKEEGLDGGSEAFWIRRVTR